MEPLVVRRLGVTPYLDTWQAMRAFTDTRGADTSDELWLTEHWPVYTQGQAGKPEHVLAPGAIPVVQSDRGGQVTYHGPGQLVAYPLLDLKRAGLGPRSLVQLLERTCLELLARFGVAGELQMGAPGVYVGGAKIASLGLRVRRGASYHGLALNVAMDLTPFGGINPCGYNGLPVTQLTQYAAVQIGDCGDLLVELLARALGRDPRPAAPQSEVV